MQTVSPYYALFSFFLLKGESFFLSIKCEGKVVKNDNVYTIFGGNDHQIIIQYTGCLISRQQTLTLKRYLLLIDVEL